MKNKLVVEHGSTYTSDVRTGKPKAMPTFICSIPFLPEEYTKLNTRARTLPEIPSPI